MIIEQFYLDWFSESGQIQTKLGFEETPVPPFILSAFSLRKCSLQGLLKIILAARQHTVEMESTFGEMLHHAAIANHIRWQADRLLNSIIL